MKTKLISFLWGQNNSATSNYHVALLILRFATGLALCTVFEKFMPRNGIWGPQEWFIADIDAMGFPAPALFAWISVSVEFFGGIFLMFGLFTRPTAILNAVVTFVAAFIYHEGDIASNGLLSFTYFIMCLSISFAGGGRYSLDYLFRRKYKEQH